MAKATKRKAFDNTLDFQSIDFRKHPELYVIGKGEQGGGAVQERDSTALEVQDGIGCERVFYANATSTVNSWRNTER